MTKTKISLLLIALLLSILIVIGTVSMVAGAEAHAAEIDHSIMTLSDAATITENCTHIYETEIIEPTCTEQGYTLYTCKLCSDTKKDNFVK